MVDPCTKKKVVGLTASQGTYLGSGFNLGQGTYGRQWIDVSLTLTFLSFSPSLSKINKNISSGAD